jgi:hypothetical protein
MARKREENMIHNRFIQITGVPLPAIQAALEPIGRTLDIKDCIAFERDGMVCVEIRDVMESWRADDLLSIIYDMLTGDLK